MTNEYEPALADFGLVGIAKWVPGFGTKGYAAPEVFSQSIGMSTVNY
jgi:hypothetical protein